MSALSRPAGAQGGRCVSHAEHHERAQRGARNFRRGTAAAPGETLRMADGAAAGRARRRRSRPRGTPLGTRGEGRWARAARRAAGSRGRGDEVGQTQAQSGLDAWAGRRSGRFARTASACIHTSVADQKFSDFRRRRSPTTSPTRNVWLRRGRCGQAAAAAVVAGRADRHQAQRRSAYHDRALP